MAYFECTTGMGAGGGATITVTYDSSFYNKTMTCSNGTKTYTKITTNSGSTEFSVSDEGTWTITCNGVSVSLDVTLNYATQMKPTGSTATPVNDIQTWLKCGGIFDKNYTTINQVLADTTTLLALISDNNAVDYMVRSTNWANSVCANATAMTDIGANNYCADTLLSDATWASAICNSAYFESVLNVKVPTMTSNTAPEGIASALAEQYGAAFQAFDGRDNTVWEPYQYSGTSPYIGMWIQYQFTAPVTLGKLYARGSRFTNMVVEGSNDGTTYTQIGSFNLGGGGSSGTIHTQTCVLDSSVPYEYVRVKASTEPDYKNPSLNTLQFYGRKSS